jgi:cysteine-rich repeat protein
MTVLGPDEVYALSSPVTASFRAELFTEGFDAAIAARPNVCASAGPSDQCFNSVARAGREALTTPNVNAGSTSFFVAKSTSAITGAYALVVTPISTCGNRTIDGAEECDDGNVDDGDGCNASCRVTATIGESCDPAMAQPIVANYGNELYRINLSGMRDALSLPCNPQRALETIVYLRAAGSGKIRVQSRDAIVGIYPTNCAVGVAPASCGTMLGPAEVTSVVAGNVYALVLEPRVLGTRQADLTIDLAQCGNNNVETSYAEGCDDGNNVNGDGCSSACIREAVCNVSWPGGAAAATFADPARPPFNRCSIVPFTGMITGNNPAATTSSVTAITLGQGDLVTATISRTAGAGGIFGVEILNSPMMGSTTTACSSGPNALNCATSMGSVNSVTWASPLGGNYYIRFFTNTIMGSDFLGSIVVTRAPRL